MTDPGVTVRRAAQGDAPGLVALYESLANGRPDAAPASPDAAERRLAVIAQAAERRLLVAVDPGGRLVGTADVVVVANLTHHGRPWAVVENVVVAADRRRRGIGRALLDAATAHAVGAGCYKIQLQSGKHRPQAHAFYRSLGFDAVSEGFKRYFD